MQLVPFSWEPYDQQIAAFLPVANVHQVLAKQERRTKTHKKLWYLFGSFSYKYTNPIVPSHPPEDLPSGHILQHITQCEKDSSHSFQLAGGCRHRVLVQDLLLDTQRNKKFNVKNTQFSWMKLLVII